MADSLQTAPRSFYCGQARASHIDSTVTLKGWVDTKRDHGQLVFVDLRDREGVVQVVFDPEALPADPFERAGRLRNEDVIAIRGRVRHRPEGTVNKDIPSGEVEVLVSELEVLAVSDTLPFQIDDRSAISEDHRLKYRYLDLRRPSMQKKMIARTKLMRVVRNYLDSQGLLEFETPILTRSTPEGARDFLVPSRLSTGSFYALPQSPQLFKQILMVSGYDKYYQIAKCFRDEDLRANRQPEFTQIDIELSFITPEDIYALIEGMMKSIFKEMKGIDVPTPFRRMSYADAMLKYGSDKPDLRFGLEIQDVSALFGEGCDFKAFTSAIADGGSARALRVSGGGEKYSNTQLKPGGELPDLAGRHGAKGLAWFKAEPAEGGGVKLESSISKFFSPSLLASLAGTMGAQPGDLILIVVDKPHTAATAMGQIRLKVARDFNLINPDVYEFTWVTEFPFLEWDKDEKRWNAMHHPFTTPHPDDLEYLESDPVRVRSLAYDLALNGEEVGGGSIRIHRADVQQRAFSLLGITPEAARAKFGFLLDALKFGAPPHGGIAFGVDRLLMILCATDSIRDVIPFPKTQSGSCLMTEAPSEVDARQLKELGIKLSN